MPKNLSGKKPANGANLSGRRSNLRSKGNKWKEQLVQGIKEKEIIDALDEKLEAQRKLFKDKKEQLKKEARQLDIDLGFIDPNAEQAQPAKIPEWKKQKMFLNEVFPMPVICRKYNGVMVYRNKLSMQEYLHRVITPEEWDANMELLVEMRALHDAEKKRHQKAMGLHTEEDEEEDADSQNGEEGDEGSEGEEEEEEEEGSDDEGEMGEGEDARTQEATDKVMTKAKLVYGSARSESEQQPGGECEEAGSGGDEDSDEGDSDANDEYGEEPEESGTLQKSVASLSIA